MGSVYTAKGLGDSCASSRNAVEVESTASESIQISAHSIGDSELAELKDQLKIYSEESWGYVSKESFGTGLRPPTENEWVLASQHLSIVENVTLSEEIQLPYSVDHSSEVYFPPIGNQDGEGSCVAWAVGYYMKTYQEASEHGWDLTGAEWEGGYSGHPTVEYQDRLISPDFIYHLINSGVDSGSSFFGAIELVCAVGACSWRNMPYDPVDHTTWPSEDAWKEAPLYRGSGGYEYLNLAPDSGIDSLKNWIAGGNLAIIGVDANEYSSLTGSDFWTLDNYVLPSVNHANTIVGYDDSMMYVEGGQTCFGAFKIANSWGVGSWEKIPDGFCWISYEAMKQRIGGCMFYSDRLGYQPDLVASFGISHENRGECSISIGVGGQWKSFSAYVYGGDQPFCTNSILLDITDLEDAVPTVVNQTFSLKVYDSSATTTTGTIWQFSLEYAESVYAESSSTPIGTLNGDYVTVQLLLTAVAPVVTFWPRHVEADVGQDFAISVRVENLTNTRFLDPDDPTKKVPCGNLYGIDLQIGWDPTVIHCISYLKRIPVEAYADGTMHSPTIPIKDDLDESASMLGSEPGAMYWLAEASMLPAPVFNGAGNLVTMNFTVLRSGQSPLRILYLAMADVSGNSIARGSAGTWLRPLGNATFSTSSAPVAPVVSISPNLIQAEVGQVFTIDVRVDNLTDSYVTDPWNPMAQIPLGPLYGVDLQLGWDPSVIHCVGYTKKIPAEVYPDGVMHSPTIPIKNDLDETASMLGSQPGACYWLAEASLLPAASFTGSGIFVTMTFTVLKTGQSPLRVVGLVMATSEGNLIGQSSTSLNWLRPPVNGTFQTPSAELQSYLAVRGAHNEIYYRTYSLTSESWGTWHAIPEGATCDSPAVVACSGELYFVVRGMDGQSIWFSSLNLADYSFSGWTWLSGATPSAPTLNVYGSKLILVVRGFTNAVYYRYYDTVSETWGDWIAVPDGATCDSPAAAVLGTSLHLVVRGFSTEDVVGNNTLWHGIVDLTDDSLSGWTRLDGATPSFPSLAASESSGNLCLSVRGMSDVIWLNTWDGAAWEGWTALPDGTTCGSPAVTVVDGELHVVVRCITGMALWHYYINLDTDARSGWIAMDGYTPSAPKLAG